MAESTVGTESPVETESGVETETAGPYMSAADARADIKKALSLSATDHKHVVLDFGANWCPDCIVLDELYRDPTVAPFFNQNFRLVTIDVDRYNKNIDISEEYGNVIAGGIPALVILRADGSVVEDTRKGQFNNARTMTAAQLLETLRRVRSI